MDDSDDEQYGATSVLLGYAGKIAKRAEFSSLDNHIGGRAIWFADTAPSAELLKCLVCNESTDLLVQISAPLDDKLYDRSIYVFTCLNPDCWRKEGSVRAIRGIHKNEEIEARILKEQAEFDDDNDVPEQRGDLGDRLFAKTESSANVFASASANPFASGSNPFDSMAQKKKEPPAKPIQAKAPEPAEEEENIIFPYKSVEVEEEVLTPSKSEYKGKIEMLDDDAELPTDASSTEEGSIDKEMSWIAASVSDPVFTKFVEVIENNPDQVLRYERGLEPVLYAEDDIAQMLRDPSRLSKSRISGARRELELQLMPHLISELEHGNTTAEGMEWGTIFVATTSDDALPKLDSNGVGYTEEWVGVQWEALAPTS